jgi:hypothetical protein
MGEHVDKNGELTQSFVNKLGKLGSPGLRLGIFISAPSQKYFKMITYTVCVRYVCTYAPKAKIIQGVLRAS